MRLQTQLALAHAAAFAFDSRGKTVLKTSLGKVEVIDELNYFQTGRKKHEPPQRQKRFWLAGWRRLRRGRILITCNSGLTARHGNLMTNRLEDVCCISCMTDQLILLSLVHSDRPTRLNSTQRWLVTSPKFKFGQVPVRHSQEPP